MKRVAVRTMPRCDLSQVDGTGEEHGPGAYNSPTRRGDPLTGGRWANLCWPCFAEHGIDTSVTELRVVTPAEVTAIARYWGGERAEARPTGEGVWRFHSTDGDEIFIGGFVYDVYEPGVNFPCFEDDGRPVGDIASSDEWMVRCVNDAPDAWFTVTRDGVKRGWSGEVRVW